LTLLGKGRERKLENTMGNLLIVERENYVLHNLVMKSLIRMILRRKNMELWR
jgi:hypothetical protein